jgi:type I restriction enzyme S subunit
VFDSDEAQAWERKRLGDVTEVVNGFGFREDLQGRTDLPFPFIKVRDMNADGSEVIMHRAANTVDEAILKALRAKTYPAGTVIFPKVGGALLTNKKRVLGVEATFDNNVMGIIPKAIESKWVFFWMQTFDLRTLANTQALPSIRQSDVENLQIPLPPVSERHRIAAQLSSQMASVEQLRQGLAEQLDAINKLPAALLRRTFSGKL